MREMSTISYEVRRGRPGTGLGLYATGAFSKGDFIVEYTGVKIPTPKADALKTRYLFEIDADWTIDGSSRDNIARYINHSCLPNAEAYIEKDRIRIQASENIVPGEEITIDYGDEYFDEFIRPVGCKCRLCSGDMV